MGRMTAGKGILDFDAKLGVLMSIVGKRTQIDLATALLDEAPKDLKYVTRPDRLHQSFKSWRPGQPRAHDPTGEAGRTFLDTATHALQKRGCTEPTLRAIIASGTVDELIDVLPQHLVTSEVEAFRKRKPRDEDMVILRYATQQGLPSIEEGYRRGVLDQRLCYLTPDAAEIWDGVVASGTYKQYDHCKDALDAFLDRDEWREFCRTHEPDGAVAFGAGSASKDIKIIESLSRLVPDTRQTLTYAVVDFSFPMLEATEQRIQNGLRNLAVQREVAVEPLRMDFMDLKPWRILRRPGVPTAWFINGGTIGNINEARFLHSVAQRAEKGDWLIIAMDTVPDDAETPEGRQQFIEGLTTKYDQRPLRELLRPSLTALFSYLKHPLPFEKALATIKPDFVSGTQRGHSAVPNSISVEFAIKGGRKEVVLLASTRYREDSFVAFAIDHGFTNVLSVPSPKNPQYRLLVFEFDR